MYKIVLFCDIDTIFEFYTTYLQVSVLGTDAWNIFCCCMGCCRGNQTNYFLLSQAMVAMAMLMPTIPQNTHKYTRAQPRTTPALYAHTLSLSVSHTCWLSICWWCGSVWYSGIKSKRSTEGEQREPIVSADRDHALPVCLSIFVSRPRNEIKQSNSLWSDHSGPLMALASPRIS